MRGALDAGVGGRQIPAPVHPPRALARVALAALCLLAAPLTAAAQSLDESSGLVGLSLPLGARVVGQGRAVAATRGELQAVPYNPAVLFGIGRGGLTYSRFEGAEIAEVNGNYLAAGTTTRWGAVAIQAVYLDYGEITITDASPDPLGTIDLSDWAIGVTYANRWRDKISYGATAKWLRTDLGSAEADGPAFDVGLVYDPRPGLPLSLGVALRNLGPDIDFGASEQTDTGGLTEALPSRVRIGIDYHPATFPGLPADYSLELSFDIESVLRELATSSQHAGAAVTIHDVIVARAGFLLVESPFAGSDPDRNVGGSVGVGVRLGKFEADVAREISVSELGDETHISASYRF